LHEQRITQIFPKIGAVSGRTNADRPLLVKEPGEQSMKTRLTMAGIAVLTLFVARPPLVAEQRDFRDSCDQQNWGDDREGFCEMRELTLPSSGSLTVDARPNGGIRVQGEARYDVFVRARIVATAETLDRAKQIVSAVRIQPAGDQIEAVGPTGLARREGWHVSYELSTPMQMNLSLRSTNGGVSVRGVEGRMDITTTNGGVKLANVNGNVRGRTTNGGVDVELEGATWQGEGLDLETNNGGVRLSIPEHYSAQLEASTVNGGLNSDFPVVMQGRRPREIEATLGGGGAPIRVKTSNGGVRITKR
jgi:putative adhesin